MPGLTGQIQSKMYVNSRVFRISSQYIFVMEKVWYSHSLLNYTHIKNVGTHTHPHTHTVEQKYT